MLYIREVIIDVNEARKEILPAPNGRNNRKNGVEMAL